MKTIQLAKVVLLSFVSFIVLILVTAASPGVGKIIGIKGGISGGTGGGTGYIAPLRVYYDEKSHLTVSFEKVCTINIVIEDKNGVPVFNEMVNADDYSSMVIPVAGYSSDQYTITFDVEDESEGETGFYYGEFER